MIAEKLSEQEYIALVRGMAADIGQFATGGVISNRNVLMDLHRKAYRLTEFTNTLMAHLGDSG